jgi:hypothetical protein
MLAEAECENIRDRPAHRLLDKCKVLGRKHPCDYGLVESDDPALVEVVVQPGVDVGPVVSGHGEAPGFSDTPRGILMDATDCSNVTAERARDDMSISKHGIGRR